MSDEFVQVTKEEYVLSVIGLGLAVDIISQLSPFSPLDWAAYIAEQANSQLDEMSEETIDKIISNHSKPSPNGMFSISHPHTKKEENANNN